VAAVGTPVLVDIERCRTMAWYARKMNDIESIRKMRPRALEDERLTALCSWTTVACSGVATAVDVP